MLLNELSLRPNFVSVILDVFPNPAQATEAFLHDVSSMLDLSRLHALMIGLSFASSLDIGVHQEGVRFLRTVIMELSPTSPIDLPDAFLHSLVYFLSSYKDFAACREHLLRCVSVRPSGALQCAPLVDTPEWKRSASEKRPGFSSAELTREVGSGCAVAAMMKDIGFACSSSVGQLEMLFSRFPEITTQDIAQVIGMMCMHYANLDTSGNLHTFGLSQRSDRITTELNAWNLPVVVEVLCKLPTCNWGEVLASLDYPEFNFRSAKSLSILCSIYKLAKKAPLPMHFLLRPWKNLAGQLSLLRHVATSPSGAFDFTQTTPVDLCDRAGCPPGKTISQPPPCWLSLSFYDAVIGTATPELYQRTLDVLEAPLKSSTEVVILALAQITVNPHAPICVDLFATYIPIFMNNHPNMKFVFQRLWILNPNLLIRNLVSFYCSDRSSYQRILDITLELNALNAFLDFCPTEAAIEIAACAARREAINFEKWFQHCIDTKGEMFLRAALSFLKMKTKKQANERSAQGGDRKRSSGSPALSQKAQNVLLSSLHKNIRMLPPELQEEAKQLKGTLPFSQEIEEEANQIFHGIYTQECTIDEAIVLLKKLKTSKNEHDQQVFACMLRNLFDEYRFFPKYPDRELRITGILFGSLIQHQLVSFTMLGVAVRYVLEALRKPAATKMFCFGLVALQHFKNRLHEWPQYCQSLAEIPALKQDADLSVRIQAGLSGTPVPENKPGANEGSERMTGQAQPADLTSEDRKFMRGSLPIDTLLADPALAIRAPDEKAADKVHFCVNNISASNIGEKCKELRDTLPREYDPWLANYLVVKRASIEPNYHHLYISLIEKMESQTLYQLVLVQTYRNIRTLLNSDKITTNQSERSLLKNLGSWLGNLTLARNKPILFKDLELKELIFDAYERARLIAVIPFVAKVLDACTRSKIFVPPNAWVMAQLRLLAEIYNEPELKLNLTFEIEVLCNNLQLDIRTIEPSTHISDRGLVRGSKKHLKTASVPQLNQPISAPAPEHQATHQPPPPTSQPDVRPDGRSLHEDNQSAPDPALLSRIAPYIHINPSIALFSQQPHLQKLVPHAIDRAIREIIVPVVDRSVPIACVTGHKLLLKDFAMEPDENKMRQAAHLMVQTLAGSLALVTCKEPLRINIGNHLRQMLQQHVPEQQAALVDQAAQQACADNLDLACKVVEKAAMEKAVVDIDEPLNAAYLARKQHRELGTGQPFVDTTHYSHTRPTPLLPEELKPQPHGVKPHQLRVYEDFARIPRYPPPAVIAPSARPGIPTAPAGAVHPTGGAASASAPSVVQQVPREGPEGPSSMQAQQPPQSSGSEINLDMMLSMLAEIDLIISRTQSPLLSVLPNDHELHLITRKLLALLCAAQQTQEQQQQSLGAPPQTLDPALAVAKHVFFSLFTNPDNQLRVDVRLYILDGIQAFYRTLTSEITIWLLFLDDEKKLDQTIVEGLIRYRLMNIADFDQYLAQLIDGGRNEKALVFAVHITRWCLMEQQHNITPSHLAFTLDVIIQLSRSQHIQNSPFSASINGLLGELKQKVPSVAIDKAHEIVVERKALMKAKFRASQKSQTNDTFRNQVIALMDEWSMLCMGSALTSQRDGNQGAQAAFINKLQRQNVFKNEDFTRKFFLVWTEISVERCLQSATKAATSSDQEAQAQQLNFRPMDIFAKLVVLLVKYYHRENATNAKASFFSIVMQSVTRALLTESEAKKSLFNQQPYHRLISRWLSDLLSPDSLLANIHWQILVTFWNALSMVQPVRVPSFSFAWLELISHRSFMPKLLLVKSQKGWPMFQQLLVNLLRFLEPYLQSAHLTQPIRVLYKGTLRVLLVLLHDFPEFLCDHHFAFCDVIPPTCIQMRNLILSAFPRHMRLPDPFTPNLKVDLLPEIKQRPCILSNYDAALQRYPKLLADLEQYLKNRQPPSLLADLRSHLLLSTEEAARAGGSKYNVSLINSLVLHIGIHQIAQLNKSPVAPITHSPCMDIFQHLVLELDVEGRHLFLNAIANQLRYPNNHTHYFSCVLLYLFAEANQNNQEVVQEQITRVLLERLIVNRPHPWGLLITFIELIKNPRYNFWNHGFTRCAPEVERLFVSVARSCIVPPKVEESRDAQRTTK